MGFLQDPALVITILMACAAILAGIGIGFAVKGIRTAQGKVEKGFLPVGLMENNYDKALSLYVDRSVIYVNISTEFQNLYSEQMVLSQLREIMLNYFSGKDGISVSAYGDKGFVAFAMRNPEQTKKLLENCYAEINNCLLAQGALHIVDVRMGVYFASHAEVNFEEAINRAKLACMMAKEEKQIYMQWEPGRGNELKRKIKIENNIEQELEDNRFFLEYQPFVEVNTRKIVGAEVLSRLNSKTEGIVPPNGFLTALDAVGLQEKFDYYVFEKNCKWIANDKQHREAYQYTINFSRTTLCDPKFVETVVGIATKYNLNLSCLAVEILEDKHVSGDTKERMIENLSALKEKGMGVLLDDFGNGFTTFADLQSLDISILKIDKSITQNAVTDTGYIVLKNIITTAKDIGYKVLCEGVETPEQEDAVIRAGCDLLQGFYYYKPMPASMLENLLNERK